MFEYELEKGSKKFACPRCQQKTFVRYVSNQTGKHLSFDVGRCDRESKCGYHQKPKQFFIDNPQAKADKKRHYKKGTNQAITNYVLKGKNGLQANCEAHFLPKKPDIIKKEYLLETLANYEQNAFVKFLLNLFPEDSEAVWQAVKDYLIGTTKDGKSIFWQIDTRRKVRTGKIMLFDIHTGKRNIVESWIDKDGETKELKVNWIHTKLKRSGHLKADFNLMQCFFGEHLITSETTKPIAVVEAEKTAVIASICFPEFVWLAIGSKQSLKVEKLKRLGQRKIVLYPDADGFALWQEIAFEARNNGLSVKVSDLIERFGTDAEKAGGFDLADYLINQQRQINKTNDFVDFYNAKLAHVLNDEFLFNDFNLILDEQKAVLVTSGNLSDADAERQISRPNNFRNIVLSI